MAIANSTGDEQQPTVELLSCSSNLTAGLHGHLTYISVFNSFLSFTVFLGNALILIALHKELSLHPPSKLLLRCLATTDLCVGLITLWQSLAITKWLSMVNVQWNICVYVDVVGFRISFILVGVSLRTMTAISVDRLLAVLLELRYRQVVTLLCFILKRTYMIVIAVQTGRTNCFFGSVYFGIPS